MRYGTRWKRRGEKKTQPCHINKLENNFPTCYILPTPRNSLPCTSHSGKNTTQSYGKKNLALPTSHSPLVFFSFYINCFLMLMKTNFPTTSSPSLFSLCEFSLFFSFSNWVKASATCLMKPWRFFLTSSSFTPASYFSLNLLWSLAQSLVEGRVISSRGFRIRLFFFLL